MKFYEKEQKAGANTLVDDTVNAIVELYETPGCGTGGNCHIVTDDDNIEDEHIKRCLERDGLLEIEEDVLKAMLKMTKTQRRKTLAKYWGY